MSIDYNNPQEPAHFAALCAKIGAVVLHAQILESSLARYLVVARHLDGTLARDEVARSLESADRATIGNLLNQIKANCPFTDTLANRLTELCNERNWLVHRLCRENEMAPYLLPAAKPVFERIERMVSLTEQIMADLDVLGDDLMRTHGFDVDEVKRRANEAMKKKFSQPGV
ncbi:MAG: hypothetical protein BWY82_00567 [Verrucomicrobia bacterium ADurb.Bin474]|nr:MAG: hypothetical protein BWY82_00567 [Verrucomicrobia bacterium ADurb.Bin474]